MFRVGVDIGGTFTDLMLLDEDGRLYTCPVVDWRTSGVCAPIGPAELSRTEHGEPLEDHERLDLDRRTP